MKNTRLFNMAVAFSISLFFLPAQTWADRGHRDHSPRAGHEQWNRHEFSRDFRRDHYNPPGFRAQRLPDRYDPVRLRNRTYFYHLGTFYEPYRSGGYVVVHAPIGARVGYLPPGYLSFYIGPRHYFYANLTYYLWDDHYNDYVVVKEPEGAENYVVDAAQNQDTTFFVYPAKGQSDELRDRDRYECYLWAVDQTGFDPSDPEGNTDKQRDYRRAISACLEGRGYTVK